MVSLIKYGTLGGGEKYETNVMTLDGLSSDELPVGTFEGMPIPNGSSFCETDTGAKYLYDEENAEWYIQPSGGGGGGGSSDNYNDLSNKPQIAGVTLSGNKSLSALGIASAADVASKADANDVYSKSDIDAALAVKADTDDIPTVNDSTITIQKNGVAVDTFTTNTALAKTINITVPTKASDISALADTVKYAGASTAGGAATSAAKLNTNAGSETQPVYFSDGVPVAGTYSLNKTVPADAVFTDTTYESKSATSGGIEVSLVTTGEKYTWNTVTDKVDKVTGKGLSTNDYTTAEKDKLAGLSNYDDTGIKAAIVKVVDDGSKNKFSTKTASTNRATWTESGDTISVEGTGTWARVMFKVKCVVGQNVLSLKVDSVSSSACRVAIAKNADATGQLVYETITTVGNVNFSFTTDTEDVYVVLYVNNSSTQGNTSLTVSNVMLCTKAEWDISNKYVPYAPTNRELYEMILAL